MDPLHIKGPTRVSLLQKLNSVRKELYLFEIFTAILAVAIMAVFFLLMRWYFLLIPPSLIIEKAAPYAQEIERVIKPLRYSMIPDLMRPEVRLSVDFQQKTWCMQNIHRFDNEGNIILAQGRYGACAELACYTYQKIGPFINGSYLIEFVKVLESSYFFSPSDTHTVLSLHKYFSSPSEEYILDPSFRRYGNIRYFDDYLFFERDHSLPMLDAKETDLTFSTGRIFPILIKKPFLIGITVDKVEDKFDRDNFALLLIFNLRHKYAGRVALQMRRRNGRIEILQNKFLAMAVFNPFEYVKIRSMFRRLFLKAITKP
jgi:hypothetical protein